MFALTAELLFWIIWDFVLSYLFYFTGALLLYLFSFGKINHPLSPTRFLSRPKIRGRSVTDKPLLVGLAFYIGLFTLAIWVY
ncbi:hypothetical protein L2719_01325 [Shewanella schlegeliana]|uniref:Uncharacterized protein n=1 Tax=Shewanella schlegeliana TaxID=190308 RepID=A0ABS1SUU4_9GAMM|nr:hypothetical protein [Shewanella schlegeliana]MBL4912327.1 hypothetical protein [Shewanella schlegeliana]MCL1108204.1 hypothetical protein [Shewanella schlegeliana]GIU22181.1 hypothetical protein TUM4433_02630 [Shewanella schlegeliana]